MLFTSLARPDLRLEAWFLWITCLAAAMSRRLVTVLRAASGLLGVALGDGGLDVLGQRLELGLDSLVTHASCLIGADTLLLRLDVCHFWSSFRVPCKKCMTPLRHGEVMQAPTIARSPSKG